LIGGIVGGILGLLCIAGIVAAVVIVGRRRQQRPTTPAPSEYGIIPTTLTATDTSHYAEHVTVAAEQTATYAQLAPSEV